MKKSPLQQLMPNLGRRYLLDVSANGVVSVRDRYDNAVRPDGLPVFSTKTRKMADSLVIYRCRLTRKTNLYILNEFDDGNVDDLVRVGEMFAADYKASLARRKADRLATV